MKVRDLFKYHIDKKLREDYEHFSKSDVMEAFDKAMELVNKTNVIHDVSHCVSCGAKTEKPTLTYCDNCLQHEDYS